MERGNSVIEKSSGKQYIIFDVCGDEICVLQWFRFEPFPYDRQLLIWQSKDKFELA